MNLPGSVAVKLDTYTLFCRQLLNHLQPLKDAVRTDPRLTCDQCCQYLNEELKHFFQEAAPRDLQQAVERLSERLSSVGYLKDRNPEAAAVFRQVVEEATAAFPTWRYQDDVEALHQQGRQMACYFYQESPWPATQTRLNREAQLVFLYEKGAELSFRANYPAEEPNQELRDVILLRFNFDCDFGLYLAYPYLFMHEYVAHIFALDYGNERFNDGWLLHAADVFLVRQGWDLELTPWLVQEQIAAFGEHLYSQRIKDPIPRKGCAFARDFDGWLNDPECFQIMTWALAAFEPQEGESDFWPDRFINHLEQEFDHDRELLRRKIESTSDLRALFETLSPV
jgi:hypothetical protein